MTELACTTVIQRAGELAVLSFHTRDAAEKDLRDAERHGCKHETKSRRLLERGGMRHDAKGHLCERTGRS